MTLLRRGLLGGLLAGLPGASFAAGGAPAASMVDTTDLALACSIGLGPVMLRAATLFRSLSDVRVHVFPIGPKLLRAQLAREVQIDLVATNLADMQDLAAQSLLAEPPFTGPWRDRLVIAARKGMSLPTAMAGIVAVPDPGTAAQLDGPQILARMGLRPQRRLGVIDTAEGASLLASGAVHGALLYASEVRADMLLAEVAPVPESAGGDMRVALAVTTGARRPNPRAFAQFLVTNAGRRMLADAGLEELS